MLYDFLDPGLRRPQTGPDPLRCQLPLDIMSTIISYIESASDLSRVSRVSRILHFLSVPRLYRTVIIRAPRTRVSDGDKGGGRKQSASGSALSALMKPGIASCVQTLRIEDEIPGSEEWWASGMWSDMEVVWAIALAGVMGNMSRLERVEWTSKSYPHPVLFGAIAKHPTIKSVYVIHPPAEPASLCEKPPLRPPLQVIPGFANIRFLHFTNIPTSSAYIDEYAMAIFSSPRLEVLYLGFASQTSTGLRLFFSHQKIRPVGPMRTRLKLKELGLRNVSFDFPEGGIVDDWLDTEALEVLSLIDCRIVATSCWSGLFGNHNSPPAAIDSPVSVRSAGSSAGKSSRTDTPRTSALSAPPPEKKHKLKLRSLRINSRAEFWAGFLSSYEGLEELYILDPLEGEEELEVTAPAGAFIDALVANHKSIKRLRLYSQWILHKTEVQRLFRACTQLQELGLSFEQSQWPFMEVLVLFLPNIKVIHLLESQLRDKAEMETEIIAKRETIETSLAVPELLAFGMFGFGQVFIRIDKTSLRVDGREIRNWQMVSFEDVRDSVGIWRAERSI
ncbi:hypothetical protein L873DRAFT_1843149 [Choiromyces venosus 120613-1]|uniref:F-box domain-containing protein n=1 Tax=Choiromyces venosus 120613-1 TaxID=1336337 RepID=A0A3N4JPK3_9PEZI|nr:hypothetical protein L873DRAFT_1843149 [Choiromyces venosus 120613-1]